MAEALLRPLLAADVPAAAALEARATAFPWSAAQIAGSLEEGHAGWALARGAELLGYAVQCQVLDEATLLNIAVDPAAQGAGLGRRLLGQVLAAAAAAGAAVCFLEVRVGNVPAIALYRRAGFAEVGRRRAYYPAAEGREDALVMRRELASATAVTDSTPQGGAA